jgi:DNA-binding IclR family transcriptional regulator
MPQTLQKRSQDGSSVTLSTTVQKAFCCLEALAALGGRANATEIAAEAGITRIGALRLLETLVLTKALRWDRATKKYSFGQQLYEWGAMAHSTYQFMPILRREAVKLASELNRRVDVLVAEGPDIVHIEMNDAIDGMVVVAPGERRARWWLATSGRVMAAMAAPEVSRAMIEHAKKSGEPLNEDLHAILEQLEQVRGDGYGVGLVKSSNNVGVVVPVFDSSECAIATLAVPSTREDFTPEHQVRWLSATRAAASRASAQLGSRTRTTMDVV